MSRERAIDRRSFLLLRPTGQPRTFELSCEQLYMRYVDARLVKRRDRLFDRLRADLNEVDELHILHADWLADDDLRGRFEVLLDDLKAQGVRVKSGRRDTKT